MSQLSDANSGSDRRAAAPRVRVYADRKGRRCGLVVGMSVAVAVVLFLWAGFMATGLVIQTVMFVSDDGSYLRYMPLWRQVLEWIWPSVSLLAAASVGIWLISAARTYARFVRDAGEVSLLAAMLADRRKRRGSDDANTP